MLMVILFRVGTLCAFEIIGFNSSYGWEFKMCSISEFRHALFIHANQPENSFQRIELTKKPGAFRWA